MEWWRNLWAHLRLGGSSTQKEKGKRELILQRIEKIHAQVHQKLDGSDIKVAGAEFARALEELDDKVDRHFDSFNDKLALKTRVEKDGELFGTGRWEILDPKWAGALEALLEHIDNKATFIEKPPLLSIPDQVSLAICGDWGTGPWKSDAPSTKVGTQITGLNCDYTIHLGDVYYAGTQHQEEKHLIDCWPQGSMGSFSLNSNHEMYSGAIPYFESALPQSFPLQQGCSYFALHNQHWLIIGLDTAYFADPVELYLKGNLNQGQVDWLQSLPKDKRIIVLSHHEGYELEGEKKGEVYAKVVAGLGRAPDYWYWGHLHNAVVYQARHSFHGRCVGHGAIPYGDARILQGNSRVVWYETQLANDPGIPLRVKNGFMYLVLNGESITEQMIDEDGAIRWHNQTESKIT